MVGSSSLVHGTCPDNRLDGKYKNNSYSRKYRGGNIELSSQNDMWKGIVARAIVNNTLTHSKGILSMPGISSIIVQIQGAKTIYEERKGILLRKPSTSIVEETAWLLLAVPGTEVAGLVWALLNQLDNIKLWLKLAGIRVEAGRAVVVRVWVSLGLLLKKGSGLSVLYRKRKQGGFMSISVLSRREMMWAGNVYLPKHHWRRGWHIWEEKEG